MTEWKEYTGSDEQIAEIINCKTDVLCRYVNGTEKFKSEMFIGDWKHKFLTQYLICNPHQLADMICQQSRTGQPVWVKVTNIENSLHTYFINTHTLVYRCAKYSVHVTATPVWNIPNAEYSFTEYSFTEFKEEV